MLLAVAGFDKKRVAEQTRWLAAGDWARFAPRERVALHFARKQAQNPAAISATEVAELTRWFGKERALDVIWWSCHCHYMTCVASAFQLPLEQENVFDGFLAADKERERPTAGDTVQTHSSPMASSSSMK